MLRRQPSPYLSERNWLLNNMLPSIVNAHQLKAMADLASLTPEGAFCEIGVYHGGSAYYLYEVAIKQDRELHLFDTFSGTPVFTEGLDKHRIDDEFADKNAPKHIADLMPLANIHIGVYPDTHPAGMEKVAFIHCDCDQYESYSSVIHRMWPLVVSGGILLFDDYPYLAGAKKAVEENFSIDELKTCAQRYYVVKR
jgi:hypothetical protein